MSPCGAAASAANCENDKHTESDGAKERRCSYVGACQPRQYRSCHNEASLFSVL
jgi:hypothetical protein